MEANELRIEYPDIKPGSFGIAKATSGEKTRAVRFYRSCTGVISVLDLKSGFPSFKTGKIEITIP